MATDTNYLTVEGANKLARRIQRYWAKKGFVVQIDVITESGGLPDRYKTRSYVQTDMINGYPRAKYVSIVK